MNNKERWEHNLSKLRSKELNLVFAYLENKRFVNALEMGAGNGFQSGIIVNFCDKLISTDLNSDRLYSTASHPQIERLVLDAEVVGDSFDVDSFDLIYSSNLLEHLPDVDRCLSGCYKILKSDGIFVNILPNPYWRLLSSSLHYPIKLLRLFNLLRTRLLSSNQGSQNKARKSQGNNLKVARRKRSFIDFLIPPPHGVSADSFREIFAFRKRRWKRTFERNNFEVIDVLNGPISSGYGLGFDRIKSVLESLGASTEYIYILRKT